MELDPIFKSGTKLLEFEKMCEKSKLQGLKIRRTRLTPTFKELFFNKLLELKVF
jgi:hypothetical protein